MVSQRSTGRPRDARRGADGPDLRVFLPKNDPSKGQEAEAGDEGRLSPKCVFISTRHRVGKGMLSPRIETSSCVISSIFVTNIYIYFCSVLAVKVVTCNDGHCSSKERAPRRHPSPQGSFNDSWLWKVASHARLAHLCHVSLWHGPLADQRISPK